MTDKEILDILQSTLKKSRFEHSIGVANTAMELAMLYDVNPNTAYRAGLLHDCVKYMSAEQLIEYCDIHDIAYNDIQKRNACALLHSKVGADIARCRFDEEDESILDAIKFHTTGKPAMSNMAKILFIADYIEPNRKDIPSLSSIRAMSKVNLDKCVLMIYEATITYIESTSDSGEIDTIAYDAYAYYKDLINK